MEEKSATLTNHKTLLNFKMKIYKYMPFREEFFSNFMLKTSQYGDFNDPFDLVLGEYGLSITGEEQEDFYNSMPEYYKSLDYYQEIKAGARSSVSVICFSKKRDNIIMWSHYANNHTGICIGYDSECDIFNSKYQCKYSNNVGKLRPVTYSKKRPTFFLPSDLINDTEYWFTKFSGWSHEKEYRLLIPSDITSKITPDNDNIYGFKIDPENIREIIMGIRMSKENKDFIKKSIRNFDINLIEAYPNPSGYRINFQKYGSEK